MESYRPRRDCRRHDGVPRRRAAEEAAPRVVGPRRILPDHGCVTFNFTIHPPSATHFSRSGGRRHDGALLCHQPRQQNWPPVRFCWSEARDRTKDGVPTRQNCKGPTKDELFGRRAHGGSVLSDAQSALGNKMPLPKIPTPKNVAHTNGSARISLFRYVPVHFERRSD